MKHKGQYIRKQDGSTQPFDTEKFIYSLVKSGLSNEAAQELAEDVLQRTKPYESTRDLKRRTHSLLYRKHPDAACRYRLKDALMKLGPTGYPFEHLMAQVLAKQGFKTQVGQQLKGKCVQHEVDVIAVANDTVLLMECKYHNQPHVKSDVKVPLYVKARFDDLRHLYPDKKLIYSVACNTRFSDDALMYGQCAGIQMISWKHPAHNSLNYLLDHFKVYPISVLRWLHRSELEVLFENAIYTTRDLVRSSEILFNFVKDPLRRKRILDEAAALND
ncbi:hypothetical protein JCM31826_15160 [Thermaurantimonas aggregans]|uniref:ATP-cone domain-containing protein n=1 Tax=Thermaurantimonas aggregans TaxID=2173829 RepID=A0A401XM11_9FLAO|nr:hypothetical protein [Thermaurantimonas aggregans]MCX8148045.1 hypothetical protein [Thermaurantimonas aggregans]GCD78034.1 hypothetical protein JCM31826_15160 [Thermaurantimonas aggregans]